MGFPRRWLFAACWPRAGGRRNPIGFNNANLAGTHWQVVVGDNDKKYCAVETTWVYKDDDDTTGKQTQKYIPVKKVVEDLVFNTNGTWSLIETETYFKGKYQSVDKKDAKNRFIYKLRQPTTDSSKMLARNFNNRGSSAVAMNPGYYEIPKDYSVVVYMATGTFTTFTNQVGEKGYWFHNDYAVITPNYSKAWEKPEGSSVYTFHAEKTTTETEQSKGNEFTLLPVGDLNTSYPPLGAESFYRVFKKGKETLLFFGDEMFKQVK